LIWIVGCRPALGYKASMKALAMTLMPAAVGAVLALALPPAQAQAVPTTRGELLYTNHCGACHSTQMHWRDKRLAVDWDTLKAQVRRWQGIANLQWSDDDVLQVARYLNDTIYRYPQTSDRVSLLRQ
jgi:mono/diheme cytochrome c family protein